MLKSAKIQFFKSQYNNWYCQNVIQIFLALLSFFATSSETYQYFQGRRSNQCHRAMARVNFLLRPENQYIYWAPRKRPLESLKWHWLFLPSIGANVNSGL